MLAVSALLLAVGLSTGVAGRSPGQPDRVEVLAFDPASGVYRPGEEAVSSLRLKNNTPKKHTFWIGYSVQDSGGNWHDAPVRRVVLAAGTSTLQKSSWRVPDEPPPPSGPYKVAVAVWDANPERVTEENRLANTQREDAFRVAGLRENFDSLDESHWRVTSKELGRGRLEPENTRVENGRLRLKLPAGTFDGGEIESQKIYQYGSYRARIKVADAPSSLTGLFLYKEPDFEKELDIEIFNDSSGQVMFTTYAGGVETNNVKKSLSFDPTKDFHDYRFDFYPGRAEFYVDGELLHRFTEGLPEDPMRLYVNAWFPTWLPGRKPETDSYVYVDWVRH